MDKFVTRSRRIDPFTVVRTRAPLTRDRCTICGFSVTERNGLLPYNELDAATQRKVVSALRAHKEAAHPTQHKPVVSEDELPTQWLSGQPDAHSQASSQVREGWKVERKKLQSSDV